MPKHAAPLAQILQHAAGTVLVTVLTLASAQAHELGSHPALLTSRAAPGIDPSTFLVGHPAGGRAGAPIGNGAHPAVLVARTAGQASIDPNAFRVQPPATTAWIAAPAVPAASTVAAAR